jgi:hypothetical protein
MSERSEEALRRQTLIRTLGLVSTGRGRCAGCQQQVEVFSKRRATSSQGKARCLDC